MSREGETGHVGQYRDINELSHSRLLLRIREDIHTHTHTIQNNIFQINKVMIRTGWDRV